jgi:gamma-glutamylcyclotransferase (GGCT)/AIG2-like uncharacterized protein YtfP
MQSSPPQYIFVYGTLLPGLAPPVIAETVNLLRVIAPATIPGRLYHLGAYPGAILDPSSDTFIHGQLLELPSQTVLERLDWYECYAAHDSAGSLFVRTTCEVTLGDGRKVNAWIYVYNRELSSACLIESGQYASNNELR